VLSRATWVRQDDLGQRTIHWRPILDLGSTIGLLLETTLGVFSAAVSTKPVCTRYMHQTILLEREREGVLGVFWAVVSTGHVFG